MFSMQCRNLNSSRKLSPIQAIRNTARTVTPSVNRSSSSRAGQENFLDEFNRTRKPPQRSIDHFSSIPWAMNIMQSEIYAIIPFYSRYLNESTGESRFFAQTVNTDATVAHVLGFCRKDLANSIQSASIKEPDSADHQSTGSDVVCLMHFGRDLESHPGIIQGGFLGSVFDEVMYQVLLLHDNKTATVHPRPKNYTLSITTKFHAPVKVPSDVLVRASLVSREGRKWSVNGQIEDGEGKILTSGESFWLTARNSLP